MNGGLRIMAYVLNQDKDDNQRKPPLCGIPRMG